MQCDDGASLCDKFWDARVDVREWQKIHPTADPPMRDGWSDNTPLRYPLPVRLARKLKSSCVFVAQLADQCIH